MGARAGTASREGGPLGARTSRLTSTPASRGLSISSSSGSRNFDEMERAVRPSTGLRSPIDLRWIG
jgi:hypothetical protein